MKCTGCCVNDFPFYEYIWRILIAIHVSESHNDLTHSIYGGKTDLYDIFWSASWIHIRIIDSERHGTIIRDAVDTFRSTTSAVNKVFIRGCPIQKSNCKFLILKHLICTHFFFSNTVLLTKTLHNIQCKNELQLKILIWQRRHNRSLCSFFLQIKV